MQIKDSYRYTMFEACEKIPANLTRSSQFVTRSIRGIVQNPMPITEEELKNWSLEVDGALEVFKKASEKAIEDLEAIRDNLISAYERKDMEVFTDD